jgi:hypothetical protein
MGDGIGAIVGGIAGLVLGPTALLGVGALVGAGAGAMLGSTLIDQPKAAKRAADASQAQYAEQARIQKAQQRLSEAQNIRGRLAQVREARQQRAGNLVRAINVGGASGTGMASFSPAAGAISSATSQMGGNVGYINASEAMGQDIFRSNQAISGFKLQEAEAMQDLSMAKTIGGLGSTMFAMGGGFDTIFGSTPNVPTGMSEVSTPDYGELSGGVSFYTGNG